MFTQLLVAALLISACGDSGEQVSNSEVRRAAALPTVRKEGKDYPYIQYPEVTGKKESRGQAFFGYPMTGQENRLLALEYTPGMEMDKLFAEDMIGASGLVVRAGQHIKVDFLPISIPVGVAPGQEWRIRYAKREFTCRSAASSASKAPSGQIGVSCTSGNYTLKFEFHRDLGVTEFQDFCRFSICTYKLADSHGLLSRTMTDFMRLPRI